MEMLLIVLITEMLRTVMELLHYPHFNFLNFTRKKLKKLEKKEEKPKKTLFYTLCQKLLVVCLSEKYLFQFSFTHFFDLFSERS